MSEAKHSSRTLRIVVAIAMSALMAFSVLATTLHSHASTNEEYCYNYMVRTMGLNTAAAAGLLANFQQESNFNPSLHGDHGNSYGLVQWNKSRKTAMMNYCSSHGLDCNSLQGQLTYLYYELQTEYPNLLATLRSSVNNSNGAYNAGYRFCYDFERPASKASKARARGNAASRTYFPRYFGTKADNAAVYSAPVSTPTTPGNYVVSTNGGNLNVRSGASADTTAVAKITDGTRVTVTEVKNGFGHVNVSGVDGWVSMDYLRA